VGWVATPSASRSNEKNAGLVGAPYTLFAPMEMRGSSAQPVSYGSLILTSTRQQRPYALTVCVPSELLTNSQPKPYWFVSISLMNISGGLLDAHPARHDRGIGFATRSAQEYRAAANPPQLFGHCR
jgi:hypothetical protein